MKTVYFFGDSNSDGKADMKNLLGGKGANLAEMTNIGIPVPPGFTITTEVCTYYYDNNSQFPKELEKQVLEAINKNEKIFIAGASGMAGRAIYNSFIKKGYGKNVYKGELLTPSHKELDLLSLAAVENWFSKYNPTVVVVAAARVGGILANKNMPTEFLLENLKIQTNLIETSFRFGVKRLLFLGSSCIYPKYASQPIK